jgi:excisionase family DNA binding protein
MSAELHSPAELADLLGVKETKVLEWCRTYAWPCVRIGRTVRFTPAQVEQIIARHSTVPVDAPAAVVIGGQTARSANRKRAS